MTYHQIIVRNDGVTTIHRMKIHTFNLFTIICWRWSGFFTKRGIFQQKISQIGTGTCNCNANEHKHEQKLHLEQFLLNTDFTWRHFSLYDAISGTFEVYILIFQRLRFWQIYHNDLIDLAHCAIFLLSLFLWISVTCWIYQLSFSNLSVCADYFAFHISRLLSQKTRAALIVFRYFLATSE